MPFARYQLKLNAKETIAKTKTSLIVISFVYYLISMAFSYFNVNFSGYVVMSDLYEVAKGADFMPLIESYIPNAFESIMMILIEILTCILGAGFTLACMKGVFERKAELGNLFDGFAHFFKILGLSIITGILVFLWSLLLVIPGIIASYSYGMALFILLENPDMKIMDALKLSKKMMRGRKMELFVLQLSFIPWVLLCILPIIPIWVGLYMTVTEIEFYKALKLTQNV